jgi:hypothetical protein
MFGPVLGGRGKAEPLTMNFKILVEAFLFFIPIHLVFNRDVQFNRDV